MVTAARPGTGVHAGVGAAAAGIVAVLVVVVAEAATAVRFDQVVTAVAVTSFLVAGVVAVALAPGSLPAMFLLLTGLAGEVFVAADAVAVAEPADGWGLLSRVLQCATFAGWVAMLATYPDGRPDRTARITAWVVGALAVLLPLWWWICQREPGLPLPDAYQVLFATPLAGLVLLVRTYRRRDDEERRRLRWLLLGMGCAAGFYTYSATPLYEFLPPGVGTTLFVGVTGFVAVTAAIGLVHPRVADVDLAIRRFPVFALLWLLIAVGYASAAALLGVGAGDRLPAQWVVMLTIVAAMLFQPVRSRLERVADRLVFGRRLDGYDALRELSASLEASTRLEEVGQVITAAVQASVDASWVRLLTVSQDNVGFPAGAAVAGEPNAVFGQVGEPGSSAQVVAPVVHAGVVVGVIECGARRSGAYTEADRELVRTVARQAALAVLNVHRAAQVVASRRRLVEAADAERTRIERDLHDGVQQHLVALIASIETARKAADPEIVGRALENARDVGRGAIVELRSVISGILPPVLADDGLLAAVQTCAGQLPIRVKVNSSVEHGRRFPREVEMAAYFFVSEALVNIARHACAASAEVRLELCDGRLRTTVIDDGVGISEGTTWRGLHGLQDRFAALDGQVRVTARAPRGTVVSGELPL